MNILLEIIAIVSLCGLIAQQPRIGWLKSKLDNEEHLRMFWQEHTIFWQSREYAWRKLAEKYTKDKPSDDDVSAHERNIRAGLGFIK